MRHPELGAEQEYFDNAADHRERRRAKALDPNAPTAGIHPAAAAGLREAHKARAASMGGPDTAVAFGRLSDDTDETYYIGRFPIFNENYDPLVISWKADKAARFARATREDPMGLRLRRHFNTESNTIIDIADDRLAGEVAAEPSHFSHDALLRALAQRRDGHLTDIVATIERAQDEVMRSPSDGILVVQGGPGTGKTVIGLQRISVITYVEQLESQDLLFVGPTSGFLQYISQVLPTLGDEGVSQIAIANLAPFRPRTIHRELPSVARVKGDARMVELLVRALRDRRNAPDDDTILDIESRTITLSPSDVWDEMQIVEDAGRPHNIARDALRERLIQVVVEHSKAEAVSRGRPDLSPSDIRGNIEFNNLMGRIWPTFSPQEFLRDLLASERRLKEHRWGLLEEDEILLIARPPQARLPDEPWTAADLALIDELEVLLNGLAGIRRYQHVVVDEAQDLSPIQLRAIQRRRAKGITILGDLAQATGAWAHRSWDEVTAHLGSDESPTVVELTIGYRVPSEVMTIANRIAESLDLPVAIPEPVRAVGEDPRFFQAIGEPLVRTAVTAIREHLANGLSVGLIAPQTSISEIGAALRYEQLQFGDGRETTTRPITLVSAVESKGLEFDAVVVVEPSEIAENGRSGLNELFVAVTRTTRALSIVYAKPLPTELADFAPDHDQAQAEVRPEPDSIETDSETATFEAAPADISLELADDMIEVLADRVAAAVLPVLHPSAMEAFLARLSERLTGDRGD